VELKLGAYEWVKIIGSYVRACISVLISSLTVYFYRRLNKKNIAYVYFLFKKVSSSGSTIDNYVPAAYSLSAD
jgi:hypothetical protein